MRSLHNDFAPMQPINNKAVADMTETMVPT